MQAPEDAPDGAGTPGLNLGATGDLIEHRRAADGAADQTIRGVD